MTKRNSIYQAPRAPAQLPLKEPWALLGQRSPTVFMRDYWHKRPLLVRQAIPSFALAKALGQSLHSPISSAALFDFACDGQSEARLVKANPWQLEPASLRRRQIPSLQTKDWTLLVQGVEARHPSAANVLSWFRFIPDARLDDLMVSIAGIGGGVGPHRDSYDVFLIQMEGRRRWRISSQKNLTLRQDLPLKILSHFQPEEDWVLEAGDLLYLPPNIAHEGIALDSGCQTWSVGFRSPSYRELLQEGLWHLAESLEDDPKLAAIYADPQQQATKDAAVLPKQLEKELAKRIKHLALGRSVSYLHGIGAYLSEPKAQAVFDTPQNPLSYKAFWQALFTTALIPQAQTRLLIWKKGVFCNGEDVSIGQVPTICKAWQELAKNHVLALGASEQKKSSKNKGLNHQLKAKFTEMNGFGRPNGKSSSNSLYEAYCSGWLILDQKP